MNYLKLVDLFFEIGSLRKIIRAHRQSFLTDDLSDNIASHSHRVSVIGYFLGKAEGVDVEKVLTMCIFHDAGESRSGDQNWVHKRYVKVYEDEILNDQIKPNSEELFEVMNEYMKRESIEAKIAKDADKLDQALLVKEYQMRGNKEAAKWLKKKNVEDLYSKTAKEIFLTLLDKDPADWWKDLWVSVRR